MITSPTLDSLQTYSNDPSIPGYEHRAPYHADTGLVLREAAAAHPLRKTMAERRRLQLIDVVLM